MLLSDPAVEIFDWPSRFLVEGTEPDKALIEFFDDREAYPYLVDIEEHECPCYDFQERILKHKEGRKSCKHLIAANRYRNLMGNIPPKRMPDFNVTN